jgi:hypothetical protein
MLFVRICVRDGSGNPTLLGVDCSELPDPCGHAQIIILIFANTYLQRCPNRDTALRKLGRDRWKLRVN